MQSEALYAIRHRVICNAKVKLDAKVMCKTMVSKLNPGVRLGLAHVLEYIVTDSRRGLAID